MPSSRQSVDWGVVVVVFEFLAALIALLLVLGIV
jgi:hypothetical protein